MDLIVETDPSAETYGRSAWSGVQPLARELWRRHAPAAHYVAVRGEIWVGRCSLWVQGGPPLDARPVGVIGHYAATDASAGEALLRHAAGEAQRHGLTTIVGPMDGNTWRSYRLVTQRGEEPPFFLEPNNPEDWPAHFTAAGFAPLAEYFSGLNSDLSVRDPRVPPAMERMATQGILLRPIDLKRLDDELRRVHALSLEAFRDNFLYTPIGEAEFVSMYAPLREHLRPELILLAEQRDRLIGFMFGLPDLAQAQRGLPIDTAIAKTIAVSAGRAGRGLGSVLLDQFHQAARALGYRRVVHALMHESNRSRQMVSKFGRPIRRYTLFAKKAHA